MDSAEKEGGRGCCCVGGTEVKDGTDDDDDDDADERSDVWGENTCSHKSSSRRRPVTWGLREDIVLPKAGDTRADMQDRTEGREGAFPGGKWWCLPYTEEREPDTVDRWLRASRECRRTSDHLFEDEEEEDGDDDTRDANVGSTPGHAASDSSSRLAAFLLLCPCLRYDAAAKHRPFATDSRDEDETRSELLADDEDDDDDDDDDEEDS